MALKDSCNFWNKTTGLVGLDSTRWAAHHPVAGPEVFGSGMGTGLDVT